MKRYLIYTGLTLAAMASAGCSESLPKNFDPIEGVYFNNRQTNNTHEDNTSKSFIYEDGDLIDVPIKIQLVGRISSEDRPLNIRVVSENAVEGVDYELGTPAALPAGSNTLDYIVSLKRTPVLKTEIKTLVVELGANGNFMLPFTSLTATDGTKTSTVSYRIEFSDQFTVAPDGWNHDIIGPFSEQKFDLICKVVEMSRSEFVEEGKISFAKWMYIQSTMIYYVKTQVDLKAAGKPYDTEAFDADGNPLTFNKTGN